MDNISLQAGIERVLDALFADRLALLCGAGLSMPPPSSLPSAAILASTAKRKYDSTYGHQRPPLPDSLDDQAQFFFIRDQLDTVYLRTYIDNDAFAGRPNNGHFAVADLILVRGIKVAVSTNVDTLIESAGNSIFGHIVSGVRRENVANLPQHKSPLLKIHGCWSDPPGTIWASGQITTDPIKTRIEEAGQWLQMRLLDHDLLIVGYSTDWDYLNEVLEVSLGAVEPSRVIVVDPCESSSFKNNAPALYKVGQRATEFLHVRASGDVFLKDLRVEFSKAFVRRVLHAGKESFSEHVGRDPDPSWLEPISLDAQVLWQIRRDLEGCNPTEPAKRRYPIDDPLLGMTMLQLQDRGAVVDDVYWQLGDTRIRVLRAPNRLLHEVAATFDADIPPPIAPDIAIAVGAHSSSLPQTVTRGFPKGSIARGAEVEWISYPEAVERLNL